MGGPSKNRSASSDHGGEGQRDKRAKSKRLESQSGDADAQAQTTQRHASDTKQGRAEAAQRRKNAEDRDHARKEKLGMIKARAADKKAKRPNVPPQPNRFEVLLPPEEDHDKPWDYEERAAEFVRQTRMFNELNLNEEERDMLTRNGAFDPPPRTPPEVCVRALESDAVLTEAPDNNIRPEDVFVIAPSKPIEFGPFGSDPLPSQERVRAELEHDSMSEPLLLRATSDVLANIGPVNGFGPLVLGPAAAPDLSSNEEPVASSSDAPPRDKKKVAWTNDRTPKSSNIFGRNHPQTQAIPHLPQKTPEPRPVPQPAAKKTPQTRGRVVDPVRGSEEWYTQMEVIYDRNPREYNHLLLSPAEELTEGESEMQDFLLMRKRRLAQLAEAQRADKNSNGEHFASPGDHKPGGIMEQRREKDLEHEVRLSQKKEAEEDEEPQAECGIGSACSALDPNCHEGEAWRLVFDFPPALHRTASAWALSLETCARRWTREGEAVPFVMRMAAGAADHMSRLFHWLNQPRVNAIRSFLADGVLGTALNVAMYKLQRWILDHNQALLSGIATRLPTRFSGLVDVGALSHVLSGMRTGLYYGTIFFATTRIAAAAWNLYSAKISSRVETRFVEDVCSCSEPEDDIRNVVAKRTVCQSCGRMVKLSLTRIETRFFGDTRTEESTAIVSTELFNNLTDGSRAPSDWAQDFASFQKERVVASRAIEHINLPRNLVTSCVLDTEALARLHWKTLFHRQGLISPVLGE